MGEYKKIETDNPILDNIIYTSKVIASSIIIKDQTKADALETKDTLFNFDTYNAIIHGTIALYYFEITPQDLGACFPGEETKVLNSYLIDTKNLPKERHTELLNYKIQQFLDSYEEMNDYYRLIAGLPPYGTTEQDIYLSDFQIGRAALKMDNNIPIHKFSKLQKNLLISTPDVMDNLKKKYGYPYLDYYDKNIDPYTARIKGKYDVLYTDPSANISILNKFLELYDINKRYLEATANYEAYRLYSPLYERFLMMKIVLSTIGDLVNSIGEFIINKEVFDLRTARYFFESYGIDFFQEIPLLYQRRIIRAINKLIKYKSTMKNVYDIASLFGFKNIEMYKYYLWKKQKQFRSRDPIEIEEGEFYIKDHVITKDPASMYELRFVRVPFKEHVNEYIRDKESYLGYEAVTEADKYWSADSNSNAIKKEILSRDFNIIDTKYISFNIVTDISKSSDQVSLFMNMLMYYGLDTSRLILNLPSVDTKNSNYTLLEAVVFAQALSYLYMELDLDSVELDNRGNKVKLYDFITDPRQLENIEGFDIYADLSTLASDILTMMHKYVAPECYVGGYTVKQFTDAVENDTYRTLEYGQYCTEYINIINNVIKKFKTFGKKQAPTIGQIIELYTSNKEVYDYILYTMANAPDLITYNIYRRLYESLLVIKLNNKLFVIDEKTGKVAKSYKEWLSYKNFSMYTRFNQLESMLKTGNAKMAKQDIADTLNNVIAAISSYIGSDQLADIMHDLPTVSSNNVRDWMLKIINVFMSYKLQILKTIDTIVTDPDPIRFKDRCYVNSSYEFNDYMNSIDPIGIIKSKIKTEPDNMRVKDGVEVRVFYS